MPKGNIAPAQASALVRHSTLPLVMCSPSPVGAVVLMIKLIDGRALTSFHRRYPPHPKSRLAPCTTTRHLTKRAKRALGLSPHLGRTFDEALELSELVLQLGNRKAGCIMDGKQKGDVARASGRLRLFAERPFVSRSAAARCFLRVGTAARTQARRRALALVCAPPPRRPPPAPPPPPPPLLGCARQAVFN
jgi:hypothetical protein